MTTGEFDLSSSHNSSLTLQPVLSTIFRPHASAGGGPCLSATAGAVIHQYEGTIAQFLGNGLLVYFGWPGAHEDDALHGVHAGLGIVEAITTTLNPRPERDRGVQLSVRIGIHTGPVVVGEMGSEGRHDSRPWMRWRLGCWKRPHSIGFGGNAQNPSRLA